MSVLPVFITSIILRLKKTERFVLVVAWLNKYNITLSEAYIRRLLVLNVARIGHLNILLVYLVVEPVFSRSDESVRPRITASH